MKRPEQELRASNRLGKDIPTFDKNNFEMLSLEKQAQVFIDGKKLDEAEKVYLLLVGKYPERYDLICQLASISLMKGQAERAITLLFKVVDLNSEYYLAWLNLGIAFKNIGDLKKSISYYKKAIILEPMNSDAFYNLAIAFKVKGHLEASIASYKKATLYNPRFAEAYSNLGNALKENRQYESAIFAYNRAIYLKPSYPEALTNLGILLKFKGDIKNAIDCYLKAINIDSTYSPAFSNLGNAIKESGNLDSAIKLYKKAISLDPLNIEALTNLGNSCQAIGDLRLSISYYQRAISIRKDYLEANLNLSFSLLLSGDYKSGWINYDWRLNTKAAKEFFSCLATSQRACPPLKKSQKLLLVGEQGLGDTLQFMRYAIYLLEKGFDVEISADDRLHELMMSSYKFRKIYSYNDLEKVNNKSWLPLLSLPNYLGVTQSNPLIDYKYISPPEDSISKWKEILSSEKKPIIGINWQGNPLAEKYGLKGRSIPLNEFESIAGCFDGSLLSLQKEHGLDQYQSCTFKEKFVKCQDLIDTSKDFISTASIIANCDLIITSDTVIAHLAGGMGCKTWLIVQKVPDWRWGIDGEKTFWYPSVKLFRQTKSGNWSEVFVRVCDELSAITFK